MAIKAKGFFGTAKSGFKLGSNNKLRGRFIRSKVNSNKNVKFAKKFFKSDRRLQKRYIRRKINLLKRKAAEKALEGGQAVKTRVAKSITKKGFNPIKFIMTIFVGWIVNQLPKIISTLKKWMEKLKPVFDTLKSWVQGIVKFFRWIGGGISKFVGAITGSTSTVDAEKKEIEKKNKELKGTLDKQKKGFDDLTKKAKGEEKNLRKDMDDLDKEVNEEKKNEGLSTSLNGNGEQIISNSNKQPQLQKDGVTTTKPKPKNVIVPYTIKNVKVRNKRGRVVGTKEVKIDKVTGKVWTGMSPDTSTITSSPKNTNINLKSDSTNKNKVVTVDVPIIRKPPQTIRDSSTTTAKQDNPDSVNSKELMLTNIEK
tara:strand:- start:4448 stop:5548 length:1101 start_codon:yes stop_codon:yes gene_type:complete